MGSTVTPPRSRGSVSSPVRYSQEATGSSRRPLRMWRAWPRAGRSTAGRRPSPHCDVDGRRGASLDSFMTEPTIHLKRWKRVEYERLVDKGVFEPGDRIELIDGLLLVSEPQSSPHYTAIRLVERALSRVFAEGWDIRTQAPIALDDTSEPEPDVAVVRGDVRDFATSHPAAPVLVVEVSLSSLAFDREHKASLYARGGRPEYWIVNLIDRVLEVRRRPAPEPAAPYGWDYAFVDVLGPNEHVSALGASAADISVGDLLP